MDLNLLKSFVAVVEAGSMTQAARRLKQPVSRVSRGLARLERDLNQHLVLRTTRSFQITESGRKLFHSVQPMIQQMNDLQRTFNNEEGELTGLVRITAPEDFGQVLIAPLIIELNGLHPGLTFDLNLTDDFVDLIRTETDIGIRAGILKDSTLKSKRLGTSVFYLVASKEYLAKYGIPKKLADLQKHRCINAILNPQTGANEWVLTNGQKTEKVAINPSWTVTTKSVALELAKGGLGITLLPNSLLPPHLESGDLVHILQGWTLQPSPIHLVYPPQRIMSKKVREVSKFFEEKLKPLFAK